MDLSTFNPADFLDDEKTRKNLQKLYNMPAYKEIILKELPRIFYSGCVWDSNEKIKKATSRWWNKNNTTFETRNEKENPLK